MPRNDVMPEEVGTVAEVDSGYGRYLRAIKHVSCRIKAAFTLEDGVNAFAIPKTQTTSVRGDVGWNDRPPAVLSCRRCGTDIEQERAFHDIDCPHCVAEYAPEAFGDLELVAMHCPRCQRTLSHGIRHPNVFDVPQWAHCEGCQYHWEFTYSF
ncbi:MAG: hypothetical protein ACQETB_11770 [Halobacteriota archaeon]